jgi:hypothetical protein
VTSRRPERRASPSAARRRIHRSRWARSCRSVRRTTGCPPLPRVTLPLAGRPRRRVPAGPPAASSCACAPTEAAAVPQPGFRRSLHHEASGSRLFKALAQPRVRRRPCLPELAAGRHSRRHRGAPPCVPFHARASCPTPSLVPTEAHPTALSLGRASTSPEQPLLRLAPGDTTEHHRRHAFRAVQPPEWNPR